ncbi:MAG: hypothetical protein RDV41_01290 [Planctomycetota bacterium]|nr:hypothetical protein [Planctomycetota bacterium]
MFDVVSEDHDSTSKGKEWLSDQIPGFLAKSETNVKAGGKTVKETAEVSAFEVK